MTDQKTDRLQRQLNARVEASRERIAKVAELRAELNAAQARAESLELSLRTACAERDAAEKRHKELSKSVDAARATAETDAVTAKLERDAALAVVAQVREAAESMRDVTVLLPSAVKILAIVDAAAPEGEKPCIGADPYCPCQDGDRCHYVSMPGSPAMTPPVQADPCDQCGQPPLAEHVSADGIEVSCQPALGKTKETVFDQYGYLWDKRDYDGLPEHLRSPAEPDPRPAQPETEKPYTASPEAETVADKPEEDYSDEIGPEPIGPHTGEKGWL